jgi:hypothetical protein
MIQLNFTVCLSVYLSTSTKGLGLAGYCPPGGRDFAIEPDPQNSPRCLARRGNYSRLPMTSPFCGLFECRTNAVIDV